MLQATLKNIISVFEEMAACETLWAMPNESLKSIALLFKQYNVLLPSELLKIKSDLFDVPNLRSEVASFLSNKNGFSVCVNGDFQYPSRLQDAKYPIQLFYYKGDLGLLDSPCISVVDTRNAWA